MAVLKYPEQGSREMVQRLGALAALAEGHGFGSQDPFTWLTIACNFSSRGSDVLLSDLHSCGPPANAHTHI